MTPQPTPAVTAPTPATTHGTTSRGSTPPSSSSPWVSSSPEASSSTGAGPAVPSSMTTSTGVVCPEETATLILKSSNPSLLTWTLWAPTESLMSSAMGVLPISLPST